MKEEKSDAEYLAEARTRSGRNQKKRLTADRLIQQNKSLISRGALENDTLEDVANAILSKSGASFARSTIERRITALYGGWGEQKAGHLREVKHVNIGSGEVW